MNEYKNGLEKIRKYLNIDKESWEYIEVQKGLKLENIEPLFERK